MTGLLSVFTIETICARGGQVSSGGAVCPIKLIPYPKQPVPRVLSGLRATPLPAPQPQRAVGAGFPGCADLNGRSGVYRIFFTETPVPP
jgi:hypothetical protein